MRDRQDGASPWEQATEISLGFVVIFGVMAIGSVHVWTLYILSLASIVCAVSATRSMPDARVQPAAWICVALAAWSAAQALPLPMALLRAIASPNADVWSHSLDAAQVAAPTWASLSLDPGASWREACRWSSYACVIFGAGAVTHRRGASWGATLLFASGIAVAVVTVLHGMSGAKEVWGLYRPERAVNPWRVGPLLNPNNLAGYLNLAFLAGLGLALSTRARRRAVILLGLVIVASVALLSASRAGVALLPLGVLTCAVAIWRWCPTRRRRGIIGVVAGAFAGAALLAVIGGSAGAWSELLDGSLEKLTMIRWLWPMLDHHVWLGIGRGAFESVSAAYQPVSGHVRFTHAEVFPVQWAIEWGIVIATIAVLSFAFVLRPKRLRTLSSATATGLYMGVTVVAVQNLFDLGFDVPGLMVAVAAAVGTLGPVASTSQRSPRRPRWFQLGSTAMLAATALVLAVAFGRSDLQADRDKLRASAESIVDNRSPVTAFEAALHAAIMRHPAEPYFPLVGALVAFHREHEAVMPWLQRSLERGATDGRVHLLLAHVLSRRGARLQALMELRYAVERDVGLRGQAGRLALSLTHEPELLLRAVPEGRAGWLMLDDLAAQLSQEYPDVAMVLDEELLRRDSSAVEARVRLATARATQLSDDSEVTCEDVDACMREIRDHANELDRVAPNASAAMRVRAQLFAATGEHDQASGLLVARCDNVLDRRRCWTTAVTLAAHASDPSLLATACEKILAESCADRARCAATAEWLGHVYGQRGTWFAAMAYYQRAMAEEPTADRLLAYARAAQRAGATEKARVALKRALSLYADRRAEVLKRLEELR